MAYPGVTVFLLFFGISLIEAFAAGHWIRAAFWLAVGFAFWAFERHGMKRRETPASGQHRPT